MPLQCLSPDTPIPSFTACQHSRLNIPPPIARQPRAVHLRSANSLACKPTRMRVLVAAVVVEDAACDYAEVLGEVQRGGDNEEAEEEEEDRVCTG